MSAPATELSTGEWAVLGLLDQGPAHGFALARALATDGEVGRIWTVPKPLVYRALDILGGRALVAAVGVEPSAAGPRRTVLRTTEAGAAAVTDWLARPVEHVRDARSLLLLKLLYLDRAGRDPEPLLTAQRASFAALAARLEQRHGHSAGFDRTLTLWRLESTTAAVRFVDRLLAEDAARAVIVGRRS